MQSSLRCPAPSRMRPGVLKAAPASYRRPCTRVRSGDNGNQATVEPSLYVPGEGLVPVLDIMTGTAMQAQQVSSCYNNCLATSVAIWSAATQLGLEGYSLQFGHLASERPGAGQVPHVWVVHKGSKGHHIVDATLSDVLPTEELFKFKKMLKYVPGKAPSPMANVGLPVEAPNQDQLEYWTENPEEYVAMLARAEANTPKAAAYLLTLVLPQALEPVKDDLQQMSK